MPDQPSSAPEDLQPRDPEAPGAVLNDDAPDKTPGGGGLRGASAADPLAAPAGAATPNSPIDTPTPPVNEDAQTEHAARTEATRAAPAEPHPKSL